LDNYYSQIKEQIINNEITKQVKNYSINRTELTTYYNIGKLLTIAGKHYGEGIIKKYSIKLTDEVGKKYNTTLLKRIRQFYLMIQKGAPLAHQLTWIHYCEIIPLKDINKITYYITQVIQRNLSKRQLIEIVKSNEYERLPNEFGKRYNKRNLWLMLKFYELSKKCRQRLHNYLGHIIVNYYN